MTRPLQYTCRLGTTDSDRQSGVYAGTFATVQVCTQVTPWCGRWCGQMTASVCCWYVHRRLRSDHREAPPPPPPPRTVSVCCTLRAAHYLTVSRQEPNVWQRAGSATLAEFPLSQRFWCIFLVSFQSVVVVNYWCQARCRSEVWSGPTVAVI